MSRVFHSRGNDSLAEACVETVLNPEYALGLVSVTGVEGKSPDEVAEHLRLGEVGKALQAAWAARHYPGQLNPFTYVRTLEGAPRPHIDQKKGTDYISPERVAVLSIAQQGIGHVRGRQFPNVILPGEEEVNHALLADMRQVATTLASNAMRIDFTHHPSQVLIIPSLPSPTAHAVVPISTEVRVSDTWDCTLDLGYTYYS